MKLTCRLSIGRAGLHAVPGRLLPIYIPIRQISLSPRSFTKSQERAAYFKLAFEAPFEFIYHNGCSRQRDCKARKVTRERRQHHHTYRVVCWQHRGWRHEGFPLLRTLTIRAPASHLAHSGFMSKPRQTRAACNSLLTPQSCPRGISVRLLRLQICGKYPRMEH